MVQLLKDMPIQVLQSYFGVPDMHHDEMKSWNLVILPRDRPFTLHPSHDVSPYGLRYAIE